MPIYEYICRKCDARSEILQRMGVGSRGLECPSCGHKSLKKQFSTFAGTSSVGAASRDINNCGSTGFT
ncbi:MAG: hypothetical protein CL486_04775 [Acidobacteria bacterium]|nr:hypothetical protein [Acidobacteriota bacterium]